VIAAVLAGVVFLATDGDPIEGCLRAIITFVIVLLVGLLFTRRKKDDA
jgi:hypothetical protein